MRRSFSVLPIILALLLCVGMPNTTQAQNEVSASDSLEKSLIDGANKVEEYAAELEKLVKERAPDALNAAKAVVRVNRLKNFSWGVLGVFVSGIFFGLCRMFMRWNKEYEGICEPPWSFPAILSGIFSVIAGILGLIPFFNIWNWVGVFEPETVLVRRVLNATFGGF